jgi:hypothetical protein
MFGATPAGASRFNQPALFDFANAASVDNRLIDWPTQAEIDAGSHTMSACNLRTLALLSRDIWIHSPVSQRIFWASNLEDSSTIAK